MTRALFPAWILVAIVTFVVPSFSQSQSLDPSMVSIPAGEFWMGRTHVWLLDELSMNLNLRLDDQPAHLVSLATFDMDPYEVTNDDYRGFVDATGHRRPYHWVDGQVPPERGRFPVYNVSWSDASAYCGWTGKRLPTEAEWERAARGGSEMTMFPWGDDLRPRTGGQSRTLARFGRANGPVEVGSFPPNGFGLYDMTGNVWEWVQDWYQRGYYPISPDDDPAGPETGTYRVMRGGGWSDGDERILALHYRNFTDPEHRTVTIGFRCAR